MYHNGLNIPTPCSAKRAMDDYLYYRFKKRLRLDGPESDPAELPNPVVQMQQMQLAAVEPPSPYGDMNDFLRRLHVEQLERRPKAAEMAVQDEEDVPCPPAEAACAPVAALPPPQLPLQRREVPGLSWSEEAPMTRFGLPDVVRCEHGPAGRCLQCTGRFVQNVPLPLYSAYCRGYTGSSSSSSSAQDACELSFAACASLVACLAPEPGERLIHLGSGTGRALVTWALLLPQSAACGIEASPQLHQQAVAASQQLPQQVRSRLFLHCGDIFQSQSQWSHATTIFVTAASFDEAALCRLASSLQGLREGTRVVALQRPLCADPSRAPTGFAFARQAAYRSAALGNCSVFIYRKGGAA